MEKISHFKFVQHEVRTTPEEAQELADRIQRGQYVPSADWEQFYKCGGYAYDIGRKAFLIHHYYGGYSEGWAMNIKQLREDLCLSRRDHVIENPFQIVEIQDKFNILELDLA